MRIAAGGLAMLAAGGTAQAAEMQEREDLTSAFQDQRVQGAFVLYDVTGNRIITVNGRRAETRYAPASTFEIANNLIALETGVIKDDNEIIPYGGKPQPFRQWQKDMSMREAIALAATPIDQELARRIGLPRYREWLEKLNYGNRETGSDVETFWLEGPLQISAAEQAQFAAALALGKLPVSSHAQTIVRNLIKLEEKDGRTLYGKTGWAGINSGQQTGWWTGWVENDGKVGAFSLNIDIDTVDDARKRQEIGKALLAKLGVY